MKSKIEEVQKEKSIAKKMGKAVARIVMLFLVGLVSALLSVTLLEHQGSRMMVEILTTFVAVLIFGKKFYERK